MQNIGVLEYLDKQAVCARLGHEWRILEGEKRICVRCKATRRIEIVR
jgi:hypothetical protein